jgi:ADP-ribose pyrophosphatase
MSEDVPAFRASTRRAYKGPILEVHLDRVRLPNGQMADLEIVRHPGAAAVVPLLADGKVRLIRQYRYAADGFILEVPAGKLDAGESPEACARREIQEEAGLRAGRLHALGLILTTPGFTDERIHLFAATALEPVPPAPEDDEIITTLDLPLPSTLDLIARGAITDAKTICALMRADQELRAGRLQA